MCCSEKDEAFKFIFNAVKESVYEIYKVDYQPTILVADASDAITNGFKEVFEQLSQRVMCWFHMKNAYKDHESFTAIKNPLKDNIRQDIYTLQLSESKEIFDSAYGLFKKKWNKVHSSVDEFLIYFDKVWIYQHPGW
jgi:hypothetical protein